ncbi:MAG: rRNA adenine dimethyltransferase family protein [bacterium]|jgi:16S rRNA (adenine1518-N6/adenine1519-N6)-dimethyltransferase|nr:rRNA adenine dimethyltransferase family protein [bacterium]
MNKQLGQHFLTNKSAIKKIIADLDLKSGETIIEIGPGDGALTFPLLEECKKVGCKLIAIEKDRDLAVKLIKHEEKIEVIHGDALKELSKICFKLDSSSFKLVGNIPYYITGKLLRVLSELNNKPNISVLMIQKEVAERIVSQPRRMNPVRGREGPQRASASNGMNLLAAAVQFWAEPKILFSLKPADFNPPPEVDSAVIKLTTKPQTTTNNHRQLQQNYYKLIHILFKQPRKTIFNNLRTGLKTKEEDIKKSLQFLNINPLDRPQNLSLEQIKSLANIFR